MAEQHKAPVAPDRATNSAVTEALRKLAEWLSRERDLSSECRDAARALHDLLK